MPRQTESRRRSGHRLTLFAAAGLLHGYAVLHPAAMAIFALTQAGQRRGHGELGVGETLLAAFHPDMLPMALAFALLGGLVSLGYALQSRTIAIQRDQLGAQLARNQRLVAELERRAEQLHDRNLRLAEMQGASERATRFLVHDFKHHLGCIDGFCGLLLQTADEAARVSVERIQRQARGMLRSVRNLLELARLEQQPGLRRTTIRPIELLQSVADDVLFAGRDERVTVAAEAESCPPVSADAHLVRRVIVNLVSNAVKHNAPGVRVSLGACWSPGEPQVRFYCRDDGEGVAPEVRAALFAPHGVGPRAPGESTGLGLAFVAMAVRAHGGEVACESAPGRGATFSFTLPTEGETIMHAHPSPQKQILVVDDDPDFAALLASLLSRHGYLVRMAATGDEALACLRSHPYDLVLLDLMLPRKNGVLVLTAMRRDPRLAQIPVIVVSGAAELTGVDLVSGESSPVAEYGDQYHRAVGRHLHEKLARARACDIVDKPIEPGALLARVDELVSGSARR